MSARFSPTRKPRQAMRWGALLIVLSACLILLLPTTAAATFYGRSGLIALSMVVPSDARDDLDIFTVREDGSDLENLTQSAIKSQDFPAWSPDGRMLAFNRGSQLHLLHPGSERQRVLVRRWRIGSKVASAWYPHWSPDGTEIVFVVGAWDPHDPTEEVLQGLGVVDVSTGEKEIILRPAATNVINDPSFSPDGKRITFARYHAYTFEDRSPGADIYMIDRDGTRLRTLSEPEHSGFDHRPAWTPAGRIMFMSRRFCGDAALPGCPQIYEMAAEGSDVEAITLGPQDWGDDGQVDTMFGATPSPDGDSILVRLAPDPDSAGATSPFGYFQFEAWVWDRTTDDKVRVASGWGGRFEPYRQGFAWAFDWQPRCTVRGTPGNDLLRGTPGRDLICGRGGDDVIRGLGGDDSIFGHGGNDRIIGGTGRDIVVGNAGRDRCDRDHADHSRVC